MFSFRSLVVSVRLPGDQWRLETLLLDAMGRYYGGDRGDAHI